MEDNRYKRAWGNESENVSVRKSAVSVRRKKMQCLYEIFSVIEDYRRKILSPGEIVRGGA